MDIARTQILHIKHEVSDLDTIRHDKLPVFKYPCIIDLYVNIYILGNVTKRLGIFGHK